MFKVIQTPASENVKQILRIIERQLALLEVLANPSIIADNFEKMGEPK